MQKKNKFLSIFLCLALVMSIIPMGYISASAETRFSGGDGLTEATAFEISTEDDLIALATAVNGGEDFDGKYFKQTADITVTENFAPIGCGDSANDNYYYFNGTYDGDRYEINGSIGTEDERRQALFGGVGGNGTIKNVTNNANVTGDVFVGGVVGENYGTIENCKNNGVITGTGYYVGGVVGYNCSYDDITGTITNCYNTGAVTGTYNYIGGVVGNNDGTIANCYNSGSITGTDHIGGIVADNRGKIENCQNNGTITGTGESCVGGVAGYNDNNAEITNSYNTGDVEGNENVGGVAGYNDNNSEIKNCYNTGKVTGTGDHIGGVVGGNDGTTTNCYYDSDKCSATDTIATPKTTLEMSTQDFVDDLNGDGATAFAYYDNFAYNYYPYLDVLRVSSAQIASVKKQTNFSKGDGTKANPFEISTEADLKKLAEIVNAGDDCTNLYFKQTTNIIVENFVPIGKYDFGYLYFNGTYDGDNNEINGTIGAEDKDEQALFGVVGKNGTIKNFINNADVKGSEYVGGVVGYNYGKIINCFNTGAITGTVESVGGVVGKNLGTIKNCYNTGTVEGKKTVGGVVGYNMYNYDSYNRVKYIGTITNCFNTGAVTGEDKDGGVIGLSGPTDIITNCYYNNEVYTVEDDTEGVEGKTTLEMSTQEFVDLLNGDGEKVFSYKPDDEDNIYYPYLTSFGEDSAVISKEKVEYEIIEGDNREVKIGTDGTLAFTSEGEFDNFKALYLGDEIKKENLVADTNYTAVSGSTKITLNADYVKTLPLGAKTFTLEFVDGYSIVNLEVTKDTPDYTIPTNLTSTYGDTLADVTLPNGFSFDDVATTPVGNVGNNIFKVTFTPDDEVNYNKVKNLEVTIKVEKGDATYTIPTNLTATYGDTLEDVTLPNGFTFDDVATTPVGNVGNNTFKVTFTPDDEVNYNKVENLEVTIKVEKAEDDKKPVVEDDNKPVVEDDKKPVVEDDKKPVFHDTENPKTDANSNFAFISILALISVAVVYGVKKKLSK